MSKELIDIILLGREERGIEYKSSLNWKNKDTKAKITKSILAMANIRDGGFIIIGVEQENDHFIPVGMFDEDFNSYSHDKVSSHIANYTDPFVEISVSKINHEEKKYVVIQVKEFTTLPVICKKDGLQKLRKCAIYTRTRRMHETAEVPSQTEMREIIDIATDIGIRKYREMCPLVKIDIPKDKKKESKDKFETQLNGL